MSNSNAFVCQICGKCYPLETRDWRCECGGLFDLRDYPRVEPDRVDAAQSGLWRYRAWLPLDPAWEPATLGEGGTPLVPVDWGGRRLHFKIESQSPTGSFKDRGAAVLLTALRGLGVELVVEDSSGNAGAALAAYAARAGVASEICVPNTAAGPKLAQMAAHGGEIIEIKGRREYAALAAWAAAAHGAYYASHVYSPYFLAGTQTLAFELWEQVGHGAPDALVLPVGNGTLLMGAFRGFQRLHQAGLITRLPQLIGVQAETCAPVHQAFVAGRPTVEAVAAAPTMASGIAIGQPARGAEILAAVRATEGAVVTVSEEEIEQTRARLAHQGFYVEETAAAAPAAVASEVTAKLWDKLGPDAIVVVPLTGHGLKSGVKR